MTKNWAMKAHEFTSDGHGSEMCVHCGFSASNQTMHYHDDAGKPRQENREEYRERCLSAELHLQGRATDHIWTMEDIEGYIGLRMDCGDSGTVYLTKEQARQVIESLELYLT